MELNNLKSNPDIIILAVDNGEATAILNFSKYSSKMNIFFQDGSYNPFFRDSTFKIEQEICYPKLVT